MLKFHFILIPFRHDGAQVIYGSSLKPLPDPLQLLQGLHRCLLPLWVQVCQGKMFVSCKACIRQGTEETPVFQF